MKQLFLILFFFPLLISAQVSNLPFQSGEELTFDIHYKYGLVMLKAGTANYKVVKSAYNNQNSYRTTLDFKTSSFFDKIYKMRDTLSSYITEDLNPLYHKRSVHEGDYHFTEEMFVNKFGKEYSEFRVRREVRHVLRFDTLLFSNTFAYDMLNMIQFIRSFNYSQLNNIPAGNVSVFVGRDKVAVAVRNEGQSLVEKNETLKYKTYRIAFDFTDNVFNESKNAIEIWMSDDENRIPIKIKAKLRIGAVEVYLTSWKNLKYPLSSEVKIPARTNFE